MAGENVWGRPKVGEDEIELLQQQEEFFKAKLQPSARLIGNTGSTGAQNATRTIRGTIQNEDKIKSHFAKSKKHNTVRKTETVSTSQGSGEVINPAYDEAFRITEGEKLQDAVQNIPIASSNIILGNIVEKKFNIKKYKFENHMAEDEIGFPKVFTSDDLDTEYRKQSLFWQKVSMLKPAKDDKSANIQKNNFLYSNNEKEADIVTEDLMAAKVHEENLEKLSQMSEEEILKEKRSLEETLDPNIIQFLRNKNKRFRKKPPEQNNTTQHNISAINEARMDMIEMPNEDIQLSSNYSDDTKMECETDTSSIPKSSKELLEKSKQKGWLHMDTAEPEKLKWMEDLLEEKKDEPAPNEWYNARFDFNGLLLPYQDENLTVDKGLHHHGEEPERPGYSLQELLQLSRSSARQQRCAALTTLANIMEKTRKGWFDKALHPAPLTALSQKNILLLLRFSLDDSSVSVVTAALQALRAFLYSEADEICLDRLYGFDDYVEPTLTPQLEDKDTSNLKDHELAQLDAIAALLRSDFLLRIRYILSEMSLPPIGIKCILEVLIRITRHSHATALNISSMPNLLETIVHNFMPLSTDELAMQDTISDVYGVPLVAAVKLCRVLVMYGKKPVAEKLRNFKVIPIILSYVHSETGKKDDINLSIESLRLWRILLHYESSDSSIDALPALTSQLQLLLSNHNIQSTSELACEHAAALIAVASYEKYLKPSICTLLTKWSTQLSSVSNMTWGIMKLIAMTLSVVDEISAFKTTWLSNQYIFSMLRSNSNLLSSYNPATDREPSCLPNLGVLTENGQLLPIVSLNSCTPLLATVLNVFHVNTCVSEIRAILEHPSFCMYIRELEATDWSFERSWYSRTELHLLTVAVQAAFLPDVMINNAITQILWKIAIKLVSALPADATPRVKKLLKIALSKKVNLEIITNELAKLNLTSTVNPIRLNLCTNVDCLYENYVSSSEDWREAAMPKDWLFLPLVHVYTKSKSDIRLLEEDKNSVIIVLSLTLILPDLIKKLSPTLRFSRLMLVYLCDTVYLDKDVSALLVSVTSDLLKKHHAKLDFKTELPGLTSFTDLFTALCEHFCSSSYGDNTFAMILLVPIAQRHNAHYRKLLWSEHAGALRYLRLPLEKLVVSLKEYLYPEEEDTSLIESYITALVRGVIKETWCPVPYAIALHHSAMYLKRTSQLAVRMRTQVEKLPDKVTASRLLQYEPPQL